jgi:cystathionine gamma-lyase
MGFEFSYVDPVAGAAAVEAAIRPTTKLVWLETPTNPMLKLTDIAAVAEVCKRRGRPARGRQHLHDAVPAAAARARRRLVVHSTTKYLNGHSDVVGGCVVVNSDRAARAPGLPAERGRRGAVADGQLPGDARHQDPARAHGSPRGERPRPAEWLSAHPQVVKASSTPASTATRSTTWPSASRCGFGGMISFVLKRRPRRPSRRFLSTCQLFTLAESLGGVESLIEHPAIMTHASIPADRRNALGIVDGFIRLSVGIEDLDDQRADLERAFAAAR